MVGLADLALEYPPPVLPGRQLIVGLNLVFGVVIECAGHLTFLLHIEFSLSAIFALLLLGIGEGLVELIIDQSVLLKTWSVHCHYLIAGTTLSLILKHFFQ